MAVCEWCEKEFVGSNRTKKARFCSRKCLQQRSYYQHKGIKTLGELEKMSKTRSSKTSKCLWCNEKISKYLIATNGFPMDVPHKFCSKYCSIMKYHNPKLNKEKHDAILLLMSQQTSNCEWCEKEIPKYTTNGGTISHKKRRFCSQLCGDFKRMGKFSSKAEYDAWKLKSLTETKMCSICAKEMPKHSTFRGEPTLRIMEYCSPKCRLRASYNRAKEKRRGGNKTM